MNIQEHINAIQSRIIQDESKINALINKNAELFKALATIKCNLERAIKNPSKLLNDAVYDAINISRGLTPYTEMSTGVIKTDNPLTEEEKILPTTYEKQN